MNNNQLDTIIIALTKLQPVYNNALQPGHDHIFSWLGVEFFVDQIRRIILPVSSLDQQWQTDDHGRIYATNQPILFMFRPDSRELSIAYFQRILAALLQEQDKPNLMQHRIGYFLTLMVAEVHYNPLALTTTLLALSKAIEQKQHKANIFDLIPDLVLDIVINDLSETEQHDYKKEVMVQQIELMKEVRPNIVAEIDELLQENSMEETLYIIQTQNLTYLSSHVFTE